MKKISDLWEEKWFTMEKLILLAYRVFVCKCVLNKHSEFIGSFFWFRNYVRIIKS